VDLFTEETNLPDAAFTYVPFEECIMTLKHLLLGAALASFAGSAQAVSINQAAELNPTEAVENVAYRCWWQEGHRVCGWYRPRVYDWYYDDEAYGWYPRRPEDYPIGSKRWWEEMDRDSRGGRR
jgi:hypothetical protein